MNTVLNKRFLDIRKNLGLTQKELASKLDISQGTVTDIERERIGVSSKVAEKLLKVLNVTEQWFYTGNGALFSNDQNNEINVKIQGENTGINTGFDDVIENKQPGEITYSGYYEDNKIGFYYRHPDRQLNKLLSVAITDLKQSFTDYMKLVKVSESFGAPDFIREKFPLGPDFKEHKKEFDSDFSENHGHITDKKLLKCFQLVAYESEIEGDRMAISQLISYMEMYTDFYKGYDKESAINKD